LKEGKIYTFMTGALHITIALAQILQASAFLLAIQVTPLKDIDSPEMHSLDPNRTIPQPLRPALSTRRRSSALPSPAMEPTPRRPERLRLCLRSEELRPEHWPGSAEDRAWCGHGESDSSLPSNPLNTIN